MFPGVERFGIFKVFQRVWRSGLTEYYPEAVYADDRDPGSWRENWVYKLPNGNIVAIYNDITKRKQAEEELRRSEAKFRAFADSLPEIVFESDAAGKLIYCNRSAFGISGYTEQDMVRGLNVFDLVHPKDLVRAKENFRKTLLDGQIDDKEYALVRKDGSTIEVLIKVKPNVVDNRVVGLRGIAIDVTERRRVEVERAATFRLLESASQGIDAGLAVIDKNYQVVWANKLLMDLGVAPNKKCFEVFNNLGVVCPDCGVEKIFKQNASLDVHEYKTVNSKGETVWIELRVTPLKDEQGQVIAAVELAVPITEGKKVEQELKEKEEKYHSLFENSSDGVMLTKPDGSILSANPAACQMLGMTEEEIIKAGRTGIVVEDEKLAAALKERAETGKTRAELTFRRKDGTTFLSETTSNLFLNAEGVANNSLIIRDYSERKKVEAKLRDSEERFRQVAENAQEWIWEVDADGLYTYVNPVVERILGYKPDEIVGKKHFYDLFSSDAREELKRAALDAFAKKQAFRGFVNCNIYKDGRLVWLSTSAMPIMNNEGSLLGYRGTDIDITEAKRAEEQRRVLERKVNDYSKHLKYLVDLRTAQLKDANNQLVKAERLAAIGELAGMVGHDLRNPIAGIKNAAYFLKKKGTAISEAQYREMLETIDKSIDRSDKIINNLLEYARELHLEKTETTMATLVKAAIQMVQVPDRIQILNYLHDETVLRVDSDKIIRVFVNLIKNAIDAMPEKGTLAISSQKTEAFFETSFTDTGIGIPEEILKKIFTPLFTTKAQGMGFGLAICKRIIEAHEGTIKVKSEPNKGTAFTLALPLKPKTTQQEKTQKYPKGKKPNDQ